ncbi:MAG: endonuclease/exonuclease/phosphatase family protein [Pseudomonas sp.]|uniref:endonuclease/exonuclease/phosphatase family protein n=1 Tax=Pseudomonas sp. TaxID=306 RepID=UPI00339B5E50
MLGAGLGRLDWRLELFSHFLPHACLALLVASWAARHRLLRLFYLLAGLGGFGLIALTLGLAPSPTPAIAEQPALRVLSFNLNLDNPDMPAVMRQIEQGHPDLVLLIEVTPVQWQALFALRQAYGHGCGIPRDDPFGMTLLSRLPLASCTVSGRLPAIEARLADRNLRLIGLHPPPPLNDELALIRQQQLRDWGLRIAGQRDVLLLGDLNLTPWSPLHRDLLATSGLRDARAGRGYFATWPSAMGPLGLPLDQALLGADWQVRSLQTGPAVGSDHRALWLELGERGP